MSTRMRAARKVVSPVEYDAGAPLYGTAALDPDDLAQLNDIANDLGVDTIETGAMLGVLMGRGSACSAT